MAAVCLGNALPVGRGVQFVGPSGTVSVIDPVSKNKVDGLETGQWLAALAALREDRASMASTHDASRPL